MLSILIPTYNNACTSLVQALLKQADALDLEIIVAEDGTTDAVALASNRWIAEMPHCHYMPLRENHGRAGIRNLLAREAKGDKLLFLDDDVMPADDKFLADYMRVNATVVCGGVLAASKSHPENLRWRYDKAAERNLTADRRRAHPYQCFTTQNFMINRDVFLSICFDENIKEYGYEDALFGIELQKRNIEVQHIDAPVRHNGLDSNAEFIKKVEQALVTLRGLPQMQAYAKVSRWASRTRWLTPLVAFARPLLRNLLVKHRPPVIVLQLYKLLYYQSLPIVSKNI